MSGQRTEEVYLALMNIFGQTETKKGRIYTSEKSVVNHSWEQKLEPTSESLTFNITS